MLEVAVCDDDIIFAHEVRRLIENIFQTHNINGRLSIFANGASLIDGGYFDIVFLDVEMEGLDGISAAKQIRNAGYNSRIVFLTAHQKYVFQAFDVAAFNYLLKPVDSDKLEQVLLKIIEELSTEKEHCYSIKCGKQTHKIPFAQIQYVEVQGRKVYLYTKNHTFNFNCRLDQIEQDFPKYFFRCHKSYIINFKMVKTYNKEKAVLENEQSVPISRRKYVEFGKAFLEFLAKDGE